MNLYSGSGIGQKQGARSSERPSANGLTKGERTRTRLRDAAATCMEQAGYHAMTIAQICHAAGVSIGTFYLYFPDKRTVCVAVVNEVMNRGTVLLRGQGREADPYLSIVRATSHYLRFAGARPALTRAIIRLCDEDAELAKLWQRENRRWALRVAADLHKRTGVAVDARTRMLVAYAMSSMVDGLLRSLYVDQDASVRAVMGKPEDLAELLAVLWYRAAYGADPPNATSPVAQNVRRLRLAPTTTPHRSLKPGVQK